MPDVLIADHVIPGDRARRGDLNVVEDFERRFHGFVLPKGPLATARILRSITRVAQHLKTTLFIGTSPFSVVLYTRINTHLRQTPYNAPYFFRKYATNGW